MGYPPSRKVERKRRLSESIFDEISFQGLLLSAYALLSVDTANYELL